MYRKHRTTQIPPEIPKFPQNSRIFKKKALFFRKGQKIVVEALQKKFLIKSLIFSPRFPPYYSRFPPRSGGNTPRMVALIGRPLV